MFNLDSLIYFQIIGALLSMFSFIIFTSALKAAPEIIKNFNGENDSKQGNLMSINNNIYKDSVQNSVYVEEIEHNDEKVAFEETDKPNKPSVFTRIFKRETTKNNISSATDEDSSTENNVLETFNNDQNSELNNVEIEDYDDDFLLEDVEEKIEYIPTVDENIDEDVFEYFPHEQRGITIFSKEDVSDVEIGDLKELISTIKEEFSVEKNVNVNDLISEGNIITDEEVKNLSYENLKKTLVNNK
ncbi:hypothetical protein CON36_35270 [Bacillus cereus]|uniref:Uncharacterized protein n=1 Tax=Bacillus cereus TaxID=1396 RepID=A0A9X6SSB4_BACCE|nr:hypothetical protein [Bacillus cereus]PDZ94162.1 hypothetical protein CON36_35270 [Bacillus cereus]PGP14432.1 hypothetical protein COA01_29135 [Bacillus cereus]